MKFRKWLIVTGIILFISGCTDFSWICSLNPFYIEKNIILVPEIEGKWIARPIRAVKDTASKDDGNPWERADTTAVWFIRQQIAKETKKSKDGKDSIIFKPLNFYVVKLIEKSQDTVQYKFKMVLFRINKSLYADFSSYEIMALKNSRFARETNLKVHTLAKVTMQNRQLNVSWLGSGPMKTMIEEKRVRVKYRWVEDSQRLLLTATSGELTALIERYADEKRFVDWDAQPAMLHLNRIN